MQAVVQSFLAGFPVLLLHFGVTVAMLAAGAWAYYKWTPYCEITLIREGNMAAAIAMAGAVTGLALPLAVCMAASVSVADIVVWGTVTIILQLLVYRVVDRILQGLPARIEKGECAPALFLVGVKFGVAMINAAAVAG
jgi:putative membrane protein